jgi:hypothetical protein
MGSNVEFAGILAVSVTACLAIVSMGAYIVLRNTSKIYRAIDLNEPSKISVQINGRDVEAWRLPRSLLEELRDNAAGHSRERAV